MKKKFLIVVLALISLFVCSCAVSGCNIFGGSGSEGNGGSGSGGGGGGHVEEKPKFAYGSGSEEDPYVISEPYQLLNVSENLDKHFELSADLNMGDSGTLAPIGSLSSPFTGSFDGKGHAIHSATISASVYSGLFGVMSGATVTNVKFKDSFVSVKNTETRYLGGFVGLAKMGTEIENCHTSNIKLTASQRNYSETFYVGGFISQLSSASKINYCSSDTLINVKSWNFKTGGFIGIIDGGAIDACRCKGTINVDGMNVIAMVGGFAAYVTGGKVSNVLAEMNITTDGYSGGLVYTLSSEISYGISVCNVVSAYKQKDLIYSASVDYSNCVAFSSAQIETANELLDGEEWKDNNIWQKGALYPQLVSYENYLAAKRHINVIG